MYFPGNQERNQISSNFRANISAHWCALVPGTSRIKYINFFSLFHLPNREESKTTPSSKQLEIGRICPYRVRSVFVSLMQRIRRQISSLHSCLVVTEV